MMWLGWALYNLGAIAACVFISIYFRSAWWMLLGVLFIKDLDTKRDGEIDGSDE
ncbi:hypothetical protein [Streptococcus lutetiensis]|uniref:hypothetical protein n=1 Tax=Streptococcus lutetiensis TaxID=150055 RepID=UPI0019635CB7|nr:hypothetical protein [Streptococcus lutetiensis]